MTDIDQDAFLMDRVTVEQLLLAASVLSAQNPQGRDFNRKKLLAAAYEFVLEADDFAFRTPLAKASARSDWRRGLSRFGYDRLDELNFVPFREAAMKITGLTTEKQAVKRFNRFIEEDPRLREYGNIARTRGIWEDLIEGMAAEEKAHFERSRRTQNRKNARRPRKQSYRDQKNSP